MTGRQEEQITHLRLMGNSCGKIAESLGISVNTVKSFCRRSNLRKGMSITEQSGIAHCSYCGKEVQQREHRKQKKFCSDACRMKWWREHRYLINRKTTTHICQNCGREFSDYKSAGRKYCCHECYITGRFKRVNDERGAVPAGKAISGNDEPCAAVAGNAPHL